MECAHRTTALSIDGALVGFDVAADMLAAVQRAFAHVPTAPVPVEPRRSPGPRVWYRHDRRPGADARITRSDDLRGEPGVHIGSTAQDLVDDLHLTVALHSDRHVYVHAGVVAWNGCAIVVPGRSRTGKSTLIEALVRAGADYGSDEYARIGPNGTVAPYARPIHLRTPAGRRTLEADRIGSIMTSPLPVGLIVFTTFRSGTTFSPVEVSPSAAALELFDNTVIAETEPDRAMRGVAEVARRARAVRTPRPDATSAAAAVLSTAERFDGSPGRRQARLPTRAAAPDRTLA